MKTVSIIGAGVGGLTLALALLQRGFRVQVFEAADRLEALGAGLTVYASALRVFDSLGLWEPIRQASNTLEGMAALHYATGQPLVPGGIPLGNLQWDSRSETIERTVHIHRADLQDILLAALHARAPGALRLGHRLRDVETGDHGALARFEGGETVHSDILVGCDGIRSAVRRSLFGEDRLEFSGHCAFRSMLPLGPDRPYCDAGRAAVYIGPDRTFQRYGLRDGALLNMVFLARTDAWREEGWRIPATREELLALFDGWNEDVTGLIKVAPADELFKWALFNRQPLDAWSIGCATLAGDAAHPILPFLGIGAGKAIDDAMVLARALERHGSPQNAFAAYEALRRDWATQLGADSVTQGEHLQGPDPYEVFNGRPLLRNRDAMSFKALEVEV